MLKLKKVPLLQKAQILAMTLTQFIYFGKQFVYFAEIKNILFYLVIALVAFIAVATIRKQKTNQKTIILYIFCAITGILSYLATSDPTLLYIALIGIIAIGSTPKELTKLDLITKIIIFSIIITLFVTGNTMKVDITRNGLLRQSLGFHHPNALGYILAMIYADILILLDDKKATIVKLSIGALFMLLILAADSRTSAIIIIILSVLELLKNKLNFARKREQVLACFVPLLLLGISFVLTILYENHVEFAVNLNQTLSWRIELQSIYHANYSIPFLGEGLLSVVGRTLDNSYFHMLYQFGIIGGITILALYTTSIKRAVSNNNKIMPHILILLSTYALMETNPTRAMITPLILLGMTKEEHTTTIKNKD